MEERPYDEIIDATCPSCRHGVPMDANVCPYCGYKIKPEAAKTMPTAKEKPPSGVKPITAKPVVGGVLIIISGLMGVIVGLSLAVLSGDIMEMLEDMYGPDIVAGLESILTACGVIWFIIGLIAVIGGIFAIRRKKWGFAVVGGVLALLTIGPWLLGSILGLIGLILVAISRNEFS